MENVKNSWKIIFNKYDSNVNKEKTLTSILNKIEDLKNNYQECETELTIFPKYENIFQCFKYFEVNETKIVLLGQDPYHTPNQATGLCFGINNVVIPPSLKNIIKELKNDLNIELNDYSLENWAKQGILMLNASLSVIKGKPGSNMSFWSDFTKFIIEELNQINNNIIFVAWGAFAYEKLKNIDLNKHNLIVSSHPSPLSVYKKFKTFPAFQGSKPFSKINEILEKNNKQTIKF